MTLWTFLAIFFGGAFLLDAYKTKHKSRLKQANSEELKAIQAELAEVKASNAQLKERVQTLEAIVTDSGFDLDKEIRKLG
ncbi:hypothetical protein [Ferrimonas balearica]|uniref:hypothetical protein n=1 Tax=Ferrimonas balearica TaxID=44012 RepID=UPI001C99137D|nr:hypothetical protein [Ferrimonas balearica]MBY5992334.1 hypothetical protein [Ferrimonas balearica]